MVKMVLTMMVLLVAGCVTVERERTLREQVVDEFLCSMVEQAHKECE